MEINSKRQAWTDRIGISGLAMWHEEVWLGYNICKTEGYEAQYAAFRMAIEFAECRPFEVVYDNQGGLKSIKGQAFLSKIVRMHRPTAPYNGSSKTIEAAFGRFQREVMYRDLRFTGCNITARGEFSRPNIDMIEANVENLYTLEELKVVYAEMRNEWNMGIHPATKRPRIEMYRESHNDEALPITQVEMVDMFWVEHEFDSTFTTSGITITVDKVKYQYEVYGDDGYPDLGFRAINTYRKFAVKYDPMDMTMVRLYVRDAQGGLKFAAEARPYAQIHRATQEQTEGEREFIVNMDHRQKAAEVERYMAAVELELEHGVAPEQHGLNRPKVAGMSASAAEKLMSKNIPTTVGQTTKMLSNMTHDEVDRVDKW